MESISSDHMNSDLFDLLDMQVLMEQDELKWYVPSDFSNPIRGLQVLLQGYRKGLFDRVMHTNPFNRDIIDAYKYRLAIPHRHEFTNKLQQPIFAAIPDLPMGFNGSDCEQSDPLKKPPCVNSDETEPLIEEQTNMDNTEQCSTFSEFSSGQCKDDNSHEQRMVYSSSIENAIENLSKSITSMVEYIVRSALDNITNNIQSMIDSDQ